MPFRIGVWELFLILLIILVVFGVGKLPELGQALGRSLREFRQALRGEEGSSQDKG